MVKIWFYQSLCMINTMPMEYNMLKPKDLLQKLAADVEAGPGHSRQANQS